MNGLRVGWGQVGRFVRWRGREVGLGGEGGVMECWWR